METFTSKQKISSSAINANFAELQDGTGINAGAITNAKLSTTAGEVGGAWASTTPTLTNLSGGTITYSKYYQIGKTVIFRFRYVLGGAGVSGLIGIALPVTASASTNDIASRTVQFNDATGSRSYGIALFSSTTTISLYADTASGTYAGITSTSSTVPHTWAVNDTIDLTVTYEAA